MPTMLTQADDNDDNGSGIGSDDDDLNQHKATSQVGPRSAKVWSSVHTWPEPKLSPIL